jgi:hypothetical protein
VRTPLAQLNAGFSNFEGKDISKNKYRLAVDLRAIITELLKLGM